MEVGSIMVVERYSTLGNENVDGIGGRHLDLTEDTRTNRWKRLTLDGHFLKKVRTEM